MIEVVQSAPPTSHPSLVVVTAAVAGVSSAEASSSSISSSSDEECCGGSSSFRKGSGGNGEESVTVATMAESDYGMFGSSVTAFSAPDQQQWRNGCSVENDDDGDADAVSSFSECEDGSVFTSSHHEEDEYDIVPNASLSIAPKSPADQLVESRRRLCMKIPSSVHLPSCLEDVADVITNNEGEGGNDDDRSVRSSISAHDDDEEESSSPQQQQRDSPEPVPLESTSPKELPESAPGSSPSPSATATTTSVRQRDFSYTPTTLPLSRSMSVPQLSVVKRTSSISIDTSIPLNFTKRGSVKVLPKPDSTLLQLAQLPIRTPQQGRELLRASSSYRSLPTYESSTALSSTSSPSARPLQRQVSFTKIQVREHKQTMGDNPSCTYGTPISLDWESIEWEDVSVDEYEAHKFSTMNGRKGRPRSLRELHMNHYRRRDILQLEGFTIEEIKTQKRVTNKIRKQREMTRFLASTPLAKIEDLVESGKRKVQRALLRNNNNSEKDGSAAAATTTPPPATTRSKLSRKERILTNIDADISHLTVSTTATTDSIAI
jgi:hypothetical protein